MEDTVTKKEILNKSLKLFFHSRNIKKQNLIMYIKNVYEISVINEMLFENIDT